MSERGSGRKPIWVPSWLWPGYADYSGPKGLGPKSGRSLLPTGGFKAKKHLNTADGPDWLGRLRRRRQRKKEIL